MTQSGQGEEPSARQAREGIVLPSDGGEPLLPGTTGTPGSAVPPGGQSWGGPWGPGQEQPPQQQDQGWVPAPQQWTGAPGAGPGPLPPEGAPAPAPVYGDHGQGQDRNQDYASGGQGYGPGSQGQGRPYGSDGHIPAQGADGRTAAYGQAPAYGTGEQQQTYGTGDQHAAYGGGHTPVPGTDGQQAAYGSGRPYPQQYPPQAPGAPAAPLPPTADGATQYLPPVPAGPTPGDEGATQFLPPVPAAPADEGATQYLPPVGGAGSLPPESASEQTRYLGQPRAAHAEAEATQHIPPYAAPAQEGERQPPAEFDNLFRSGPAGGESPAGATQQLPRVEEPGTRARPQPAYGQAPQGGPAQGRPSYSPPGGDDGGRRRGGRSGSRWPLIAAVGVVIVVVGVGAGALLSGGGDGHGGDGETAAASAPAAGQESSAPAADPAKQQAIALDKLLADSGSSRATVIQSVANVKQCKDLGRSAADLREAAGQRGELVTRLGKLSVDRLPGNADLTAALTRAWQASAAADNHYAAWAGQVSGKRGCHKGQARTTGQTQAGNRESGTASAQKAKAAALWNAIAKQYGLTQRQPTQL